VLRFFKHTLADSKWEKEIETFVKDVDLCIIPPFFFACAHYVLLILL